MKRLARAKGRRRREEPAGAYEIRFRLERSFRAWGAVFLAVGVVGFILVVATGYLPLLLVTGAASGAGIWIYWNDPRDYLVVQPRRQRLQLVRCYGKKTKNRGEWRLGEFERLETAQYQHKKRGLRCLITLWGRNQAVEKVDDRPDDAELRETCREVAETAGLDYRHRGRVDVEPARIQVLDEPPVDADA